MTRISVQVPTGRSIAVSTSLIGGSAFSTVRILASHHCSSYGVRSEEIRNDWSECGVLALVSIQVPPAASVAPSAGGIQRLAEETVRILTADHCF